jgi:outer membrane protein OmpA-like peptidoglycan-associated protein
LKEVAKLMQTEPALRVWVVGHTDNTGTVETNMRLLRSGGYALQRAFVGISICKG